MKHGKRPSVRQKMLLKHYRLNPDNWLIVKDLPDRMEITHRETGTKKVLAKAPEKCDGKTLL